MSEPRPDPVAILKHLVAFRSDVVHGDEHALSAHLAELLRARGADEVSVVETPRSKGKPSFYVYARYGRPKLLVNAHFDTVPPNADWSGDPFVARIDGDRLYALGASDTKGASAAILAALEEVTPKDIGILFSGDEEHSSVSMRAFVAGPHRAGIERAIVCEPTNLRVGVRHRGFVAFEVVVNGPGGHSSLADTLPAPLAMLSELAMAYVAWGDRHKGHGPPGFPGMCLNIAKLGGGIAFNVIPAEGRLLVSIRPPPRVDAEAICVELEAIARDIVPGSSFHYLRENSAFATHDLPAFQAVLGDRARAPIDLSFWTEAALFEEAGIDAVVMGVGDIAQAHAPDEWVSLSELREARDLFRTIFENAPR